MGKTTATAVYLDLFESCILFKIYCKPTKKNLTIYINRGKLLDNGIKVKIYLTKNWEVIR
jgi:hypothetical protein